MRKFKRFPKNNFVEKWNVFSRKICQDQTFALWLKFSFLLILIQSMSANRHFLLKCLCQAMEHKYALDEFWIQKLDFKRRVDAAAFANLHEVRAIVNNIFLLVVRNNLGPKEVAEWQENLVFIEYLATNLGSQSHSWAMQKLKEVFGGKQGMSSSKKSLADKIVRQTPLRTQGMLPQMQLPPPPQHLLGEVWV